MLDTVCHHQAAGIVRWNPQLALYNPHDTPRAIDFCPALKRHAPDTIGSVPVGLQDAETSKTKDTRALRGTLHVYRMPAQAAQAARQKVHRTHQKKQRTLSAKPVFLRQCVLIFPSLSSQGISGATGLAIYRCRWQIA
jgi:hypothetical protein